MNSKNVCGLFYIGLTAAAVIALCAGACRREPGEGPAETAGRKIDNAGSAVKDAVKDTKQDIKRDLKK
jgi:hypothetical protein